MVSPEPKLVQLEVNPVVDPEFEQQEVVSVQLSDPHPSVTVESYSLPRSLPPKIYLGPYGEVIPLGLISIEE